MTYEDNKEWINHSVAEWVRSGVCVVARDPDTGMIGGTLLATILTREQANTYQQALTSPKTKVGAQAGTEQLILFMESRMRKRMISKLKWVKAADELSHG